MANVNKVILIGRLTADPELRFTQAGTAVCDVNMATNRRVPGKDGGEGREEVCFVNVTFWGKTAEAVAEYLKKGREVYIEGYLKLDQWEDQATGQKRSKLKVVAERMQFLGGKKNDQGGGQQEEPAPTEEGSDIPF